MKFWEKMKKTKRALAIVLAAVMLLGILPVSNIIASAANEPEQTMSIKDIVLKKKVDGNYFDINNGDTINNGDSISLSFNWSVLNSSINVEEDIKGQYDMGLKGLDIPNTIYSTYNEQGSTTEVMGEFKVEDGVFYVTIYKDYANTKSNRSGKANLDGTIEFDNSENLDKLVNQPIEVDGNTIVVVDVDCTQVVSSADVSKTAGSVTLNPGTNTMKQSFSSTIKAKMAKITVTDIEDSFGGVYSNLSDIKCNGTSYASLADLAAAIGEMNVGESVTFTYTLDVTPNADYWNSNDGNNDQSKNKVTIKYKNNLGQDKEVSREIGVNEGCINKPSLKKSGSLGHIENGQWVKASSQVVDENNTVMHYTVTIDVPSGNNDGVSDANDNGYAWSMFNGMQVDSSNLIDKYIEKLTGGANENVTIYDRSFQYKDGKFELSYNVELSDKAKKSEYSFSVENTIDKIKINGYDYSATTTNTLGVGDTGKVNKTFAGLSEDKKSLNWTTQVKIPDTGYTVQEFKLTDNISYSWDNGRGLMFSTTQPFELYMDGITAPIVKWTYNGAGEDISSNYTLVKNDSVVTYVNYNQYDAARRKWEVTLNNAYLNAHHGETLTFRYKTYFEDPAINSKEFTNTINLDYKVSDGTNTYTGSESDSDSYKDISLNAITKEYEAGETVNGTAYYTVSTSFTKAQIENELSDKFVAGAKFTFTDKLDSRMKFDKIASFSVGVNKYNMPISIPASDYTVTVDEAKDEFTIVYTLSQSVYDQLISSNYFNSNTVAVVYKYSTKFKNADSVTSITQIKNHVEGDLDGIGLGVGESTVTAKPVGEFIQKEDGYNATWTANSDTYHADHMPFTIKVNPGRFDGKVNSDVLTLTDTLGKSLTFDSVSENDLKITMLVPNGSGGNDKVTLARTDNPDEVVTKDSNGNITSYKYYCSYDSAQKKITFIVPDEASLEIYYTALITLYADINHAEKLLFTTTGNSVKVEGTSFSDDTAEQYTNARWKAVAQVSGIGETCDVTLHKFFVDDNGNTQILTGSVFSLYECDYTLNNGQIEFGEKTLVNTVKLYKDCTLAQDGAAKGTVKFENLQYDRVYVLEEVSADEGFTNRPLYYFSMKGDSYFKLEGYIDQYSSLDPDIYYENVQGDTGKITITKSLKDVDASILASVEDKVSFVIKDENGVECASVKLADIKNQDGSYNRTFKLPVGKYTVEETVEAITGYTCKTTYKVGIANDTEGTETPSINVTKDSTTDVVFTNTYSADKGSVKFTKKVTGDLGASDIAGKIKFTLYKEDNTKVDDYIFDLTKWSESNGTYEFTINDLPIGKYYAEETVITPITGVSHKILYSVGNNSAELAKTPLFTVTKDQTITVGYENKYTDNPGKFVLIKRFADISLSVVDLHLEDIKFEVTSSADSTYLLELTLADFAYVTGVGYVYQSEDVKAGTYTVTETGRDIAGYTTKKTSYVVSADGQNIDAEGDEATTAFEVSKGGQMTVAFTNTYEEKPGKLTITKTVSDNVTQADAEKEGAIEFKVTNNSTSVATTYKLSDFSYNSQTKKWTKELEVVAGGYTVEETAYEIDGFDYVKTTYTVGNDNGIGISKEITVGKGEAVTIAFANEYSDADTEGQLIIVKKLIDVEAVDMTTALNSIKFRVTNDADETDVEELTLSQFMYEQATGMYIYKMTKTQGSYTVEEYEVDIEGYTIKSTKYSVNTMQGDGSDGTSATASIVAGEDTTVLFVNSYEAKPGKLVITKTIEGDVTKEEAEGALEFKVTNNATKEAVTYKLSQFSYNEQTKTWSKELEAVAGGYTVEESVIAIDGYKYTGSSYKIGDADIVEVDETKAPKADTVTVSKGGEITVAFADNYTAKPAKIIITKTITGAVTKEEAEGALKFKVTNNATKQSTIYTLAQFSYDEDAKVWTKELEVVDGGYTVEESVVTITGYKFTKGSYKVGSANKVETTTAPKADSVTVDKDETVTVAFTNEYAVNPGKLIITKTIGDTVTKEEAEGTLVFKVTNKDKAQDTAEYHLSDFTYDTQSKMWTLELEKSEGGYEVEETVTSIDGYTLKSVKYTVANEEHDGTKADVTVVRNKDTKVDFKDEYEELTTTGKLVIIKTLANIDAADKVTALASIKFKITSNSNPTDVKIVGLDEFDYVEALNAYRYEITKAAGNYTVEETARNVAGYDIVSTKYAVGSMSSEGTKGTVAEAEVVADGTINVGFVNTYEPKKAKVTITKTINGAVTKEEAEGSLKFKVTNNSTNESTEYTLAQFTYNTATKTWTKELEVVAGGYTVEESVVTIDGYTFTKASYKVGDATAVEVTTAPSTEVTLAKGSTTTIAFENNYTVNPGKLVITKTVGDTISKELAESSIKITVTNKEDATDSVEYSLSDFDYNATTKVWKKELSKQYGTYIVEETATTATGFVLASAKYTIGTEENDGTKAEATVAKNVTPTVAFTNSYEPEVTDGKLILGKVIFGVADADVLNVVNNIKFKITSVDNPLDVVEVELKDFETSTLDDYTIYVYELEKAHGKYNVEEIVTDAEGYTLYQVSYIADVENAAVDGNKLQAEIVAGEEFTVLFANYYNEIPGKLVITKTIEGDVTKEEAEGTLVFKVTYNETGVSQEYKLSDFEYDAVTKKWTLDLNAIPGGFTVEESVVDIDGYTFTKASYKVGTADAVEVTTAPAVNITIASGKTTEVAFTNNYETKPGELVITKTIEGAVTKAEAEGALKFKVTNNDTNETAEYTLADFDSYVIATRTWTKTLELNAGGYTVEETVVDIDGYVIVSTTYSVGGATPVNGKSSSITLDKGAKETVAFTNKYTEIVPSSGKLIITKTIDGAVTKEEAEGALEFEVTNNSTNETVTYKLIDFEYVEAEKLYKLELTVVAGGYTVVETVYDIEGYDLARVTYKVNDNNAIGGLTAEVTVAENETVTVAYTDKYATTSSTTPDVPTGDSTPLLLYGVLLVLSLIAMISVVVISKKKKKSDK